MAKWISARLAAAAIIALGWSAAALAEDSGAPTDGSLALDQSAVDPAVLQAQNGTPQQGAAADLAGMPGGTSGAVSLDQPTFPSSTTVTGGLVSSSSLQATVSGGSASLAGQ